MHYFAQIRGSPTLPCTPNHHFVVIAMQMPKSSTNTPPPSFPPSSPPNYLHTKMAKLTVFAAFIFLAGASTTAEDENQRCQGQVQQMRMRHCMQYMQMGTPYAAEATNRGFDEEDMREECCNDLGRVILLCRCEALRHMMRRMQEEYGMQEQMHMMRRKAEMLPETCGMTMPRPCHFGSTLDI